MIWYTGIIMGEKVKKSPTHRLSFTAAAVQFWGRLKVMMSCVAGPNARYPTCSQAGFVFR